LAGGDYVVLMLDSGARPSEVLALRWCDLDFEAKTIRLVASVGQPKLDAPLARKVMKTKSARRTIPVNPRALAPLQERRGDVHDEALVFATSNGRPQDHRNVSHRWLAPIASAAGLPRVNLYDLRHTHATRLMEKGVPIFNAAKRLGTSMKMLESVYAHATDELQGNVVDLLD